MIIDAQTLFSQGQALTSTGNTDSTNVIDLGAKRDIAVGDVDLYLFVEVTTAFTSGGSATLAVSLLTDTAANFGSAVTLVSSAVVPVATLTSGYALLIVPLPFGIKRYLKLVYAVGTAAMTAGAVTAGIVDAVGLNTAYASGIDVSTI